MARAIALISASAAYLPLRFTSVGRFVSVCWHHWTHDTLRPYRPELHYMRGPGPAWRAKHGQSPTA